MSLNEFPKFFHIIQQAARFERKLVIVIYKQDNDGIISTQYRFTGMFLDGDSPKLLHAELIEYKPEVSQKYYAAMLGTPVIVDSMYYNELQNKDLNYIFRISFAELARYVETQRYSDISTRSDLEILNSVISRIKTSDNERF